MMKKLLAFLLALSMLVAFAACSDENEEGTLDLDKYIQQEVILTSYTDEDGHTFTFEALDSDSVAITGYSGSNSLHGITVPASVVTGADASISTKKVAAIAPQAFSGVSAITSVVLPEGLTSIGKQAFADCVQLASVTLPSTIKTIDEAAFYNCGLTEINFPATCGLTEIAPSTFQNCTALTSVTVPGYIATIGQGAFMGCTALKTVVLSEGVSVVGNQAFQNTTALASLTLPATFTNTDPYADLAFSGSDVLYRENIVCGGDAATAYADKMPLATAPEA